MLGVFCDKKYRLILIGRLVCVIVIFLLTMILFFYQFDTMLALIFGGVLTVIDAIFLGNKELIRKTKSCIYYFMIPISLVVGYFVHRLLLDSLFADITGTKIIILLILAILKCYAYLIVIIPWIISSYFSNDNLKKSLNELGVLVALSFFVWIFIPTSMFSSNKAELGVSYWLFVFPLLIAFFISVFLIYTLILSLTEKDIKMAGVIVSVIIIGSYVQYLFFNINLGELNGAKFYWSNNYPCSITDAIIWIAIIILAVIAKKNNKQKIFYNVSYFIFGIQLLTTITIIITSSKAMFSTEITIASGEQQFNVAEENNTVIFVLDAVDNSFAKKLYETNPEVYADLKDFTFYTNTCSVYDFTALSMPQMFTGSTYDSCDVDYVEFYNRLHRNDYKVLFFNYEEGNRSLYNIKPFLDNYYEDDNSNYEFSIDCARILSASLRYSLYNIMPNMLKELIKPETISFNQLILVSACDESNNMFYDNVEFYNNMHLTIDGNMKNAFIMQHIKGAHLPCDDFVNETEYCMRIVADYINQMKVLGVYDDSTIIITADHGVHAKGNSLYPIAATPVFLIKEPNSKHTEMNFCDAPIEHTDFLATILLNAGLYNEEVDAGRFGFSIYDFEGKERERTCYYRNLDAKSSLCVYRYIGNTDELIRKVANDEYSVVTY